MINDLKSIAIAINQNFEIRSVTMATRGLLLTVAFLIFDFPRFGSSSPQPFNFNFNPGRNIPIRISTPRIENPANNIRIRNPGRNIPVNIQTPTFQNPSSGLSIFGRGQDFGDDLDAVKMENNEVKREFFLIQTV